MIRVAIVADSPVHRAGLASVIGAEADVRIVGTTGLRDDVDGSLSADVPFSADDVDVVIVVPGRSSPRLALLRSDESDRDARVAGPATMVLLERLETGTAQEAYAEGASAVLGIDAGAEELRAALRAIAAGMVVLPARMSAELLASSRSVSVDANASSSSAAPLTSREREVLALLAQGLANKVIAVRLGITEHTVKSHIAAVYEKLDASNRAEVLVAAARQGLVIL